LGVPRSHDREAAASSDNELINVSLTQRTATDGMPKTIESDTRGDQGKAGLSDLCSKDKLGCAVSERERLTACDGN
jgi:hypothetical protein